MTGLLRHGAFFALTVAGCLVVTLAAAWLGGRRTPFERMDTVTASSLEADYRRDARSELSPPLLIGIIDAAAQDEAALSEPGTGEPPRSESEPVSFRTTVPTTAAATTPALPQITPTIEPTRAGTATAMPTQASSPTSVPPTSTPVPPKPTDTPRPTSTPTRIINLPCGSLPGEILDGINGLIRPTCTPTPTYTPKPTSTPTPKLTPTATRTPIIDLFPDDWPLVGDL
jgi:hypothetical protein